MKEGITKKKRWILYAVGIAAIIVPGGIPIAISLVALRMMENRKK